MTAGTIPSNPFQAALGRELDGAAVRVRDHFARPPGTYRYRGVMRRVWRRRGWRGRAATPALWAARLAHTLFPETGDCVPFDLEHTVEALPGGQTCMTFRRTFHFPCSRRHFDAHLTFDLARGAIVDRLGRGGLLEVELHPWVERESGALHLRSGRQWLRAGSRLRVPIPRRLAGHARVVEWQEPDGGLGISVVVSNAILGDFFGYEGTFRPVAAAQPMRGGSDNAAALRRRRAWVGRVLLGVLAVAGTIAYALSFRTVPTAAAWLPPAGAAVGAAAGVSWLAFGAVLMLFTRGRPAPLEWADACLRTMAAGIAVLTVGTAFNLGVSPLRGIPLGLLLGVHAALLVIGNVVMGVMFSREARRLGLGPAVAIAAWTCALDGVFALILMALYRTGA
jgi:hypothetical protein